MKKKIFKTKNSKETILLGQKISLLFKKGDIIELIGEIGSGKTQLAKGIIKGFGINDLVTSPTFSLMQIYGNNSSVFHIDGYRFKSMQEAYESGIQEAFKEENIVIVEWGDLIRNLYNGNVIKIYIKKINKEIRKIIIGV